MQFALDANQNRIHINCAKNHETYFCPYCGSPLIQKRGAVRIPHYAHAQGFLCNDNWHYEEMTEWHLNWQECYPVDCREVVMEKDGIKHRADILVNHTVVEFQHSSISIEDFKARNDFYTALGCRVIWLFDLRDTYLRNLTVDEDDHTFYHWKYAPKTFLGIDLSGDIQVYFQLADQGTESIIRLMDCRNGDLSWFCTHQKTKYGETEFLNITIGEIGSSDNLQDLRHELFAVRRKNGEKEFFGCPINYDNYAPMIREEHRTACDQECPYFQRINYDNKTVICSGRYREHLDRIQVILDFKKSESNIQFSYLDHDYKICKATVEEPKNPASTILDIAKEYNPKVMIVRNVKTGVEFKITRNPIWMFNKYNQIYGFMRCKNWRYYEKESRKIYYADEPNWILEWFVGSDD